MSTRCCYGLRFHVFWCFDVSIPSPDRSYVFLRSWLFLSPSFTSIWVMWFLQNETKDQLCSMYRHGVHILPNTVTYLLIPGMLVMNCWIVLHSLRMMLYILIGKKNDAKCLNWHWEVYLHVIESFFVLHRCQGYNQSLYFGEDWARSRPHMHARLSRKLVTIICVICDHAGLFSNHGPLYFVDTKRHFSKLGLACHIAKIHSEASDVSLTNA